MSGKLKLHDCRERKSAISAASRYEPIFYVEDNTYYRTELALRSLKLVKIVSISIFTGSIAIVLTTNFDK